MKSTIVVVVLVVLAASAAVQVGSLYLAKGNLQEVVDQALYSVDDSSKDEVKGNIAAKAPALVATPLPPLNFSQHVQLCPAMTAIQHTICRAAPCRDVPPG